MPAPKPVPERKYLSLSEASALSGPSKATLRAKISSGALRGIRFSPGGKIYVEPQAVQALAIAIRPEPPQSQEEFRARMNAVALRAIGGEEGLRQARRAWKERRGETVH